MVVSDALHLSHNINIADSSTKRNAQAASEWQNFAIPSVAKSLGYSWLSSPARRAKPIRSCLSALAETWIIPTTLNNILVYLFHQYWPEVFPYAGTRPRGRKSGGRRRTRRMSATRRVRPTRRWCSKELWYYLNYHILTNGQTTC